MGTQLLGRAAECEQLDRLVADVAGGTSRVLILRGDAGVGKSALLEHLLAKSDSYCRISVTGVQSEIEMAYSGLHQLCAPLLHHLDHLPAPQRTALATVFGLEDGPAPDPFLVGLATLSLLAEGAERTPVVCVVDDAHWLDRASAQVVAFVGRRLLAERIAIVCATRTDVLPGLPDTTIHGLGDVDARTLLRRSVPGGLDPAVRDQIIAESHGNPLALIELPRTWQQAGGYGFPGTGRIEPVAGRIEQSYTRRITTLPADTQLLVLVAAVEPLGDVVLLHAASDALGLDLAAATPAVDAGLLEIGGSVRFAHPLVRSAAYRVASVSDRRRAHRALAEAHPDPDRRAWHRAQAAAGPDEDVAAELERSAGRAQSRGGLAAAAAFRTRAAELTPDRRVRVRRAVDAAFAGVAAGAVDSARTLLATAAAGPLDERQQARTDLLRAQLAFVTSRGRGATPLLLAAARRLEPLDPPLARETYLDAMVTAWLGSRLSDVDPATVAEAVPRAPTETPVDFLLDAFIALTGDFADAVPACRAALAVLRDDDAPESHLRRLWEGTMLAIELWDDESWDVLSERHLRAARRVGALQELPFMLGGRAPLLMYRGELSAAWALAEENYAINEATGIPTAAYGAVCVAAARGDEPLARRLIAEAISAAEATDEGTGIALAECWHALLCNGLGQYDEALAAAVRSTENAHEVTIPAWALPELVEAATRHGSADVAVRALARLSERTLASGTDRALGVEARCRALVTGDEASFTAALTYLGRTRARADLARAHLVYGEWLRRESRRADAKQQLTTAFEMFAQFGMAAFAERARRELLAVGAAVRKRSDPQTSTELTVQEAQIARLAQDGLSNPEIGAHLFLSARTVEWHLRKVFGKLGITSRRQLRKIDLP
ncbi:ATP-binding protein [Cryptosporangium phraense]|uniref:AAA family ATPase n=1 Tax=Cryptosporangium phraense TaxID=2593070 RepID=A0A545AKS1_9ACTN|nr:LuxR family transcriptional regulator [Cryptosporangium phraense]TQS41909.1 AAA family ATPase [Cryptosporangium phraense]